VNGDKLSQYKRKSNNLFASSTFATLVEKIRGGDRLTKLSGLNESSKQYLATSLSIKLNRPILYVVDTIEKAIEAQGNFSFFSVEIPPVLFRKEQRLKDAIFSSVSKQGFDRINWLYNAGAKPLLISDVQALFEFLIPKKVFEDSVLRVESGGSYSREHLISRLVEIGYDPVEFVQKEGEYSRRGSIVDLFSPGEPHPIRLEFSGDEINSMRYFGITDQKSIRKIEKATILPASEIILNDKTIRQSTSYIRKKAIEKEIPATTKHSLIDEASKAKRFPYIDRLLPSFYPELSTVFDYLPEDTLIVFDCAEDNLKSFDSIMSSFFHSTNNLERNLKLIPEVNELYLTIDQYQKEVSRFQRLVVEDVEIKEEGIESLHFLTEKIQIRGRDESLSTLISKTISAFDQLGYSVLLVFSNEDEKNKFNKLTDNNLIQSCGSEIGDISSGFVFHEAKLALISERDLLGERKRLKSYPVRDIPSAFITSFGELKTGDYIVHRECGIGIYRGLKKMIIGETEGDFLICEYQGGDKIYVPIDKIKLVQRYIGDRKSPSIGKLGQQNWKRVLKRVGKAVENIAKELIEVYARRRTEKGFRFTKRDKLFREFEYDFPYEETPDQASAIEDVMYDMELPRPMDRLICGDVGFGKTEVAIRAAFKAVMDGKQVAFLVPTTLLAFQHLLTSEKRLNGHPVIIETISRFKSRRLEKEIYKKLEEGKIDIIIGTHKLLSKNVKFKDLGLVIIDEEHRFGVKHKEKLRNVKKGVDILTLSATPIPRTLQLSLTGIRDISLMNTPPEGRQPIETYVFHFSKGIIRQAILDELKRGGTVFFIHNRIEDILSVAKEISSLVPEARVEVTHGRMKEERLENSINNFIEGKTDILVTTAIVESGLDIPRANTIIINDAQRFGLADLYQLRGRVGRSEKRAFSYFLIPSSSHLTQDARRRLKAISELTELGSGYKLALSDLEIRGAGNLFGTEQSGHISDVGLELYLEMLEKSIRRLRKEDTNNDYEPEIRFNFPAFFPDDYVEDDTERLLIYKKLSGISSVEEISSIEDELIDRFGKIPLPGQNLLSIVEIKILLRKLQIEELEMNAENTVLLFSVNSSVYKRFKPTGIMRISHKKGEGLIETKKRLLELINVTSEKNMKMKGMQSHH